MALPFCDLGDFHVIDWLRQKDTLTLTDVRPLYGRLPKTPSDLYIEASYAKVRGSPSKVWLRLQGLGHLAFDDTKGS